MAYLALLWKARTIEKYRQNYEKEKISSMLATNTELPRNAFYQKLTLYRNDSQKKTKRICRNCYPEGLEVADSFTCLQENSGFLLKIVIGIVGGILWMYFSYTVFVSELAVWSIMSWVIAAVITLGLAFSCRVRCLVLLLIPGLFSRVGRYTLACYALVLILTGPATNTLKNLDTLSDSLACGQEQIRSSVKQIKESKDNPLILLEGTMDGTIEKIQYLAAEMKKLMVNIHRLTMSIAHVLQSSLFWLNSVETICNTKLGTPYDHCIQTLAPGAKDCQKEFPEFSHTWNLDIFIQAICFTLKPAESICVVGDFAKGSIVAAVKKKLNTYTSHIQSLLSLSVHVRRSHSCCSNGSLPVSQAAAGIVTDLRNRADPLLTWLSWSCTLTGLFLLLIIFRAKYYQLMFRTRSRFDNRYVTKELRELDLRRKRQGRETVLPLNTRERVKYVSTASFRLLPSERMYLTRSIVFMVITTFKLMIHMVADYSLYWVLMNIRFHGSAQQFQPGNRTASILVSGSGPLAAIVRKVTEALSVPLSLPVPSSMSCLPDPHPPDLQRYAQIGSLILLLWLLALFEPYGLRLRHVITGHYQPDRAKARAVWLYYHIIRTRSCFLKYARRKLHRQYKYTSEEKFTFERWLNNCIPCRWLLALLGVGPREPRCLLCCTKHHQDDLDRHLQRCETPSCPGVYCAQCFIDIGQLCTICYLPEDYGDLSDVSLEKFSSDDSGSDDADDDYKGDNKLLLRTSNYDRNEERNGTNRKHDKENESEKRPSSSNNNQESIPLLDCDYLDKDYSQQNIMKHESFNNLHKPDEAHDAINKLKTHELDLEGENISNEILQRNTQRLHLQEETTLSMETRDGRNITKDKIIPKGKRGVIMRTIMLLTAKVNDYDGEYVKYRNKFKEKPLRYLVLEMSQLLDIVKQITLSRPTRCVNCQPHVRLRNKKNNQPAKIERKATQKLGSATTTANKNIPTVNNIQNSKEERNNVESSKWNKNIRCRKRNMKGCLEIRRIIATLMIQRLRKRRILFNIRKFPSKKRRCNNNNSLHLSLISIATKVFSTEATENEESPLDQIEIDKKIKTNQLTMKMKDSIKQRNHAQKNDYCSHSKACSLTNITTVNNFDIQPSETGASLPKEINEINDIETDEKADHKTMDQQIKQIKDKKFGFWASLWLRIKGNHSPLLFKSSPKDEPLINGSFTNHKRRKKLQNEDEIEKNTAYLKTRKDNDETRRYRISLFLKDYEWFTKGIINETMNLENDEIPFPLDSKRSKRLTREQKRLKKMEIRKLKREINLRLSNEANIKKAGRDANLTEERQKKQGKKCSDAQSHIFICDAETFCKLTPITTAQNCNFKKILKSISRTASNSSKHSENRYVSFNEPELNISQTVCNVPQAEKIYEDEQEYNEDITNNAQEKYDCGCIRNNTSPNSSELVQVETLIKHIYKNDNSNEETVSEESTTIKHQIKFNENLLSDINKEPQYLYDDIVPKLELGSPSESSTSCDHVWQVEPKKHGTCQTARSNDWEQRHIRVYYPNQSPSQNCFQVELKLDKTTNKTDTDTLCSIKSLKNSKGTQAKNSNTSNNIGIEVNVTKVQEDKGVIVYPDQQTLGCQYEETRQTDQQTQTQATCHKKRCQTEYYPVVRKCFVHNAGVETQRTETCACASQYKSSSSDIVTLTDEVENVSPTETECSQVTIEYTDEKPAKPKRNRVEVEVATNKSTTTETMVADASTVTSDWWSPMVERKNIQSKSDNTLIQENAREKEKGWKGPPIDWDVSLNNESQSKPPNKKDDAVRLSASRYLLQSEEYFSQIYSMELGSSQWSFSRFK